MSAQLNKYIDTNPEILGGTPVVAGTRIPIDRIYYLLKQGYSLENLQLEYSWVDKKKIQYTVAELVREGLDAFKKTQKIQAASR